MEELFKSAAPSIFSGILLLILGTLVAVLRGIAKDLRELKTSFPVLTERLSGFNERLVLLEQRRAPK